MSSRTSQKSQLSPSSIDMGRKSEPSVTSGGIGVRTEVTNIGGVTVTGGVNVEISPIDVGISYDPSENSLGVAGGVEIPGGLLGVSGGVTIDLDTGEVIGSQIGGEALGLGVNVSNSKKGGLGVGITLQIPFTPIELELGFGFPPKKKPRTTPTPSTSSFPGDGSDNGKFSPEHLQKIDDTDLVYSVAACKGQMLEALIENKYFFDGYWYFLFSFNRGTGKPVKGSIRASISWNGWRWNINKASYDWYEDPPPLNCYAKYGNANSWSLIHLPDLDAKIGDWVLTQTHVYQEFSYQKFSGRQFKENLVQAPPEPDAVCLGGFPRWVRIEKFKPENPWSSEDNPPKSWGELFSDPPSSPPPPFPNPPPRKQNKMDTCCQENLKLLRAIYKGLGIAKFPGKLPESIIQTVPNEGEEPAEPPQVPIADFVDLLDWQFRRDDERWGQWEIQIDVKDADVTIEGDQKKQIKFPNLAESIAEIEGQILSLTTNTEALMAITTKNLVESGLGRQEAIKSYLAAKSIIKYMAFKTTEIDVDIPACYTPGAETIDKLVDESTIHFKGIDYLEKETLRDIFLDLLQSAAIIRAIHWERINTKKDVKGQIVERLMGIASLANSVKNPTPSEETQLKPKDSFEDFLDKAEDGHRTVAGITNAENPYGRNPNRRPRIRQIGDNISQAGKK